MAGLMVALAFGTAVVAALRGCWSPCGRSMLSTITPMAEAARGQRYFVTAGFFVVGATAGGAALGSLGAFLAFGVHAWGLSDPARSAMAVGLAAVAFLVEAGLTPLRLPVLRRQVNERWLDEYRGWCYGLGFGFQIGAGLLTYVMTPAVLLVVALSALGGHPLWALEAGILFGACRGSAVFASRGARTPEGLLALHRRFDGLEAPSRLACLAAEGVAVVSAAVGLGALPALAAAGILVIVATTSARRRLAAA